MKNYAENEEFLCQPRKMLISSYFLENGTLITPLLLFNLDLGLVCKNIIASWNIFQVNVSINLCSLLSMPVEKETRIQTELLSRKQRSCLPTAPTFIKLWIVVTTLSQNI